MFTHRAASEGLPGSLQYMQEGDVVLWNQVPHFVYKIGAVTYQDESEILFRTPQQQGRNCGLANRDGYTAFLSDVARELEPPRAEDIAWAHAVAAAVKDGTPEEALPPPPPLPPVWRNPSARRRSKYTDWCEAARRLGLPRSLHKLQVSDVVTWQGVPYFVRYAGEARGERELRGLHLEFKCKICLSTPEQFAGLLGSIP